jgi:hypothetical protein
MLHTRRRLPRRQEIFPQREILDFQQSPLREARGVAPISTQDCVTHISRWPVLFQKAGSSAQTEFF